MNKALRSLILVMGSMIITSIFLTGGTALGNQAPQQTANPQQQALQNKQQILLPRTEIRQENQQAQQLASQRSGNPQIQQLKNPLANKSK